MYSKKSNVLTRRVSPGHHVGDVNGQVLTIIKDLRKPWNHVWCVYEGDTGPIVPLDKVPVHTGKTLDEVKLWAQDRYAKQAIVESRLEIAMDTSTRLEFLSLGQGLEIVKMVDGSYDITCKTVSAMLFPNQEIRYFVKGPGLALNSVDWVPLDVEAYEKLKAFCALLIK